MAAASHAQRQELHRRLHISRDCVMRALACPVPRSSVHLPRLHPRLFESQSAEASEPTARPDSFESEPLLQTVSRSDLSERGPRPGPAKFVDARAAGEDGPGEEGPTASRIAFDATHHVEAAARRAGQQQPRVRSLVAVVAASGALALLLALIVAWASEDIDGGLMTTALIAPLCTASGLTCAWACWARGIHRILDAVRYEVRAQAPALLCEVDAAVLEPLRRLRRLIDEVGDEQGPGLDLARLLREQRPEEFARTHIEPRDLTNLVRSCEDLLEQRLAGAKRELPGRIDALLASSHVGKLASHRPSFTLHMVLLPMSMFAALDLGVALLHAHCEQVVEAAASPGPGATLTRGSVTLAHASIVVVQLFLASGELAAMLLVWRRRRICAWINRAITIWERKVNEDLDLSIRASVDEVFREVLHKIRTRSVDFFQQYEEDLDRMHAEWGEGRLESGASSAPL